MLAIRRRLTDYLAKATATGSLRCVVPEHAASLLLGALIADFQLRSLLGCASSRLALDRHVVEAVAMFMARYGVA
jgi:hypothetical protein